MKGSVIATIFRKPPSFSAPQYFVVGLIVYKDIESWTNYLEVVVESLQADGLV